MPTIVVQQCAQLNVWNICYPFAMEAEENLIVITRVLQSQTESLEEENLSRLVPFYSGAGDAQFTQFDPAKVNDRWVQYGLILLL